jgi:hypothetical protein
MGKLCIIMQHITLCTLCIAFMLVSHTCIIVIDHAEQGRVEPSELAPVEGARPRQAQVHLTTILEFILFSACILIMIRRCALGYRSWLDTLVAL